MAVIVVCSIRRMLCLFLVALSNPDESHVPSHAEHKAIELCLILASRWPQTPDQIGRTPIRFEIRFCWMTPVVHLPKYLTYLLTDTDFRGKYFPIPWNSDSLWNIMVLLWLLVFFKLFHQRYISPLNVFIVFLYLHNCLKHPVFITKNKELQTSVAGLFSPPHVKTPLICLGSLVLRDAATMLETTGNTWLLSVEYSNSYNTIPCISITNQI